MYRVEIRQAGKSPSHVDRGLSLEEARAILAQEESMWREVQGRLWEGSFRILPIENGFEICYQEYWKRNLYVTIKEESDVRE